MSFTDYYKELELEKGASEEEIKKAFRRLARLHHPDTNPDQPDAEDKFKRISEAYEVLGDPQKRAKYDAVDSQYRSYTNSGQGRTWQDFGRSGSYKFNMDEMGESFNGTSFGDLLSQLFGSNRQRPGTSSTSRAAQTQTQPRRVFQVTLSLDEALDGITKRFTIDGKKVDVAFRPGIADGQRLRLPEGELEVKIMPHERFTRVGDDLRVTETVAYATAVLGGSAAVRTLAGTVNMNIPAGSQAGKTFRLKGQGMPNYDKPTVRGDLYVTISIDVPTRLTDEQRVLIEKLRESGL